MSSVVATSTTAAVGTPPDQKNASIEPSRSAWADSPTPSPRLAMSSSGSSPAAAISRSAITSVPELGEPTETVLPLRSSIVSMPESAIDHDLGDVRVQRRQRAHASAAARTTPRP